jgi:hypothetical protein
VQDSWDDHSVKAVIEAFVPITVNARALARNQAVAEAHRAQRVNFRFEADGSEVIKSEEECAQQHPIFWNKNYI